jgi:hypothetical protein
MKGYAATKATRWRSLSPSLRAVSRLTASGTRRHWEGLVADSRMVDPARPLNVLCARAFPSGRQLERLLSWDLFGSSFREPSHSPHANQMSAVRKRGKMRGGQGRPCRGEDQFGQRWDVWADWDG